MSIAELFWGILGRRAETARLPPPTPPGFKAAVPAEDSADLAVAPGESDDSTVAIGGIAAAIIYDGGSFGPERRRITCHRAERRGGLIYLQAYCHERRAPRLFRFDRIREIADWRTGEIWEPPSRFLDVVAGWGCEDVEAVLAAAPKREAARADQKSALGRCRDGIRILAFLARCDGNFHLFERDAILAYCEARAAGRPDEGMRALDCDFGKLMDYADRQYPDTHVFLKACACLRDRQAGERHLRLLMDSAARLIDADGAITPEEFDFALELKEIVSQLPANLSDGGYFFTFTIKPA